MVSDLFFDQDGDGLPSRVARGSRDLPGTVYFGLKPPPDLASSVVPIGARSGGKHGLIGNVSPDVLHVTLCPIGVLPGLSDERIDSACRAASSVIAEPFELLFDRVGTYDNRTAKPPFVVRSADSVLRATLFRHALIRALRRSGFTIRKDLPELHMTLFYDRRIAPEESIDPIRWIVRDFVLIHSISGEGRHSLLGQWPLRGHGGSIHG